MSSAVEVLQKMLENNLSKINDMKINYSYDLITESNALESALLALEFKSKLEKGLDIDWLENEELESNLEARRHYAQFSDFIKNKYFKKEVLQNGK